MSHKRRVENYFIYSSSCLNCINYHLIIKSSIVISKKLRILDQEITIFYLWFCVLNGFVDLFTVTNRRNTKLFQIIKCQGQYLTRGSVPLVKEIFSVFSHANSIQPFVDSLKDSVIQMFIPENEEIFVLKSIVFMFQIFKLN